MNTLFDSFYKFYFAREINGFKFKDVGGPQFLVQKKRLRLALVQDVAILIWLIAKILLACLTVQQKRL